MKKLLILSNILLLGIIAYLLYSKKDIPAENKKEVLSDQLKGGISFEAASLLSELYISDSSKSNTVIIGHDGKPVKVEDSRSVSLQLEGLNNFIHGIQEAAKRVNCTKPMGVRIYFSKYPDVETMQKTPTLQDVPKEYANKMTFFFVATILDKDQYRDFNPAAWKDCENPPYYTKSATQKSNNPDDPDWIYNHGDLIPPPEPGPGFPPNTN